MDSSDLPICVACGSQYDSSDCRPPERCKICDDPRQFVPPAGQSWTTLARLRRERKNKIVEDEFETGLWHIFTEEKFGIGQRAIFLETQGGNVLWDLVALLDNETVDLIKSKGGLKAIVISHPHFYTTYAEWAKVFQCPVYISKDDEKWLCRRDEMKCIKFIEGPVGTKETVLQGVRAVKCGGHFDGSLILHWKKSIGISDTMVTIPSAYTPNPRPPGQTTYSFLWSIPNMIPLPPDTIHKIWLAIKELDFDTSYGNFTGMTVHGKDLKKRTLESMQEQVKAMGYSDHELLDEKLPLDGTRA